MATRTIIQAKLSVGGVRNVFQCPKSNCPKIFQVVRQNVKLDLFDFNQMQVIFGYKNS